MFAVALFGAVVTFILSAQAGLIAGNKTAAKMSQAVELARCRMSELEEKQLKLGFPEIEDKDSSNECCNEKEVEGFSCEWQVERVKLPESTALGGDAGLGGGLNFGFDGGGIGSITSGMTGAGGASLLNPAGGAGLDLDSGLANIGNTLNMSLQQQFGGAGSAGLLSMVFGIVYPSLKPVLESAIRRITVKMKWKEGAIDRDFTLTQYVTNPSRAGLLAGMLDGGLMSADGGAPPANVVGPGRAGMPGAAPQPGFH